MGHGSNTGGWNHHLLGKSSPDVHTRAATQNAYRLAHTRGLHVRAPGQDVAHTIAAQDVRQRRPGWVHGQREESIRRIQRREPYPDQYLARSRLRIRHIPQTQFFDASI